MPQQKLPFTNFRNAIKAVPAFFGGRTSAAKDLLNWKVSDDGWLVPRDGSRAIDLADDFDSIGALDAEDEAVQLILSGRVAIRQRRRVDLDDLEITLYTEPANSKIALVDLVQRANNPLGQKVTSRAYYLPFDSTYELVRNNSLLLLVTPQGNYFIDIENNVQYEWRLDPPIIRDITLQGDIPEVNELRNRILIYYRAGTNSAQVELSDYPIDTQADSNLTPEDLELYGYKAVYYNPDIEVRSASSYVSVDLVGSADSFIDWMYDPNITDRNGNIWAFRYQALQGVGIINATDVRLIENMRQGNLIEFAITGKPNWASHIELYRAEVPNSVIELESDAEDFTITDITKTFGYIFGLTGTLVHLIADGVQGGVTTEYILNIDDELVQALDESEFEKIAEYDISAETENTFKTSINETGEYEGVFLDALYNQNPPDRMSAICKHAGRIYGVDRDTQEVVASHIDGNGISQWLGFPPQNKWNTEDSGQSPVQSLQQQPSKGGIYVFKRDAIHFLDGQNIWSGLYDIEVGTNTDIDASGVRQKTGCITRHAIETDGTQVIFVGNNRQIYSMRGREAVPIGVNIKPFIEDIPEDRLNEILIRYYNEQFYVVLPDSVLVLDTERKYWTRYDWNIHDMFWYQGGLFRASKLYGISETGTLQLEIDNPDDTFGQQWTANTQISDTFTLVTGLYVYSDSGQEITVVARGNEPPKTITRRFIPTLSNKYRVGFHLKTRHLDVTLTSEEKVSIDRIDIELTT